MSRPAPVPPPVTPPSWPMLRAMGGVGLLCGVLIVTVYELTKPVIARNQAQALQAAIFEALPAARSSRTFRWEDTGGFARVEGAAPAGSPLVYAGYDDSGALVGLAAEGAGIGYQDTIRLLWGYSPADEAIVGLQVLESKETPGLGDKILTDAEFHRNFERLDVRLNAAGDELANPVVAVKSGQRSEAWQLDGITGATISSAAVAQILDQSAGFWLPKIRGNLDAFEGGR